MLATRLRFAPFAVFWQKTPHPFGKMGSLGQPGISLNSRVICLTTAAKNIEKNEPGHRGASTYDCNGLTTRVPVPVVIIRQGLPALITLTNSLNFHCHYLKW